VIDKLEYCFYSFYIFMNSNFRIELLFFCTVLFVLFPSNVSFSDKKKSNLLVFYEAAGRKYCRIYSSINDYNYWVRHNGYYLCEECNKIENDKFICCDSRESVPITSNKKKYCYSLDEIERKNIADSIERILFESGIKKLSILRLQINKETEGFFNLKGKPILLCE
jgi:hypothetical protein